MEIKKKFLSFLLILGSIFTGGVVSNITSGISSSKAAIDLPGGLECDSSMNSTSYSIYGPATLEVSSILTEEERIALIKNNFIVTERKNICLSNGNLSSTTTELGYRANVTKDNSSSDLKYKITYEDATTYVILNQVN